MGFTFDDTDVKGVASPLSDMRRLVANNPKNADRIFPFIGGEELNDHPTQLNTRFIINFDEMSETDARACYPELMKIVEDRVKPERQKSGKLSPDQAKRAEKWWLYSRTAKELYEKLKHVKRALVVSLVTKHLGFSFLPAQTVFSHKLGVFPEDSFAFFGCMQSTIHEIWTRTFSSTMKDDLNYSPSDCFETFPFPNGFKSNSALEAAGREYYEFRAELMQDLWLGLTEIYNHFHSPDDEAMAQLENLYSKRAATNNWRTAESVPADRSPLTLYATPAAALAAVRRLRTLHAGLDTAVLTAYGWTDLLPKCTCDFLLDYEDEESDAEEPTGRRKKKPWRYRWPDEVRDEVLARLLKLNAERAEEERLTGVAAAMSGTPKPKKSRAKPSAGVTSAKGELLSPAQGDLFANTELP